jgi:thiol-disulfide isomerase/thioredoxin
MLPIDGRANPKVAKHHLQRADLLEQIIAVVPANQRDPWIRQVADSLSTAIQASDPGESVASRRLQSLHEQLEKAMPRSDLTAYVVYRQLQANYSTQISTSKDINQVQEDWLKKLASFAESYPKAEDTADALLQLGMVCEFLNKEDDARKWYRQLARDFPSSVQAAKARGAEKRLQLEGQPLTLRGPLLESPGQTFDIASLQGNVVAVYYWASWNSQCASDFAKLSQIQKDLQGKLKVVAINLDNEASEARQFLDGHAAPGTVLFQEGGLESELANSYGIMVLPTLFLVDKDGRVSNRNLPISSVEDEVRKLLK